MQYKHVTTGQDCTPQAYIAELVCTREASKKSVRLVGAFWQTPTWKLKFAQAVIAANKLLKLYSPQAILAALSCKEGNWIYSLHYKGLNQLCLIQQERLDKQAAKPIEVISLTPTVKTGTPVKPFGKKNNLNKLRELDDCARTTDRGSTSISDDSNGRGIAEEREEDEEREGFGIDRDEVESEYPW